MRVPLRLFRLRHAVLNLENTLRLSLIHICTEETIASFDEAKESIRRNLCLLYTSGFLMMAVLLLKHVIMIDNKLKNQNTVDKKPKTADPEFISREPKKPAPTPAPAKPAVRCV